MAIHKFYKGFSTRNYEETGQLFAIYNVECVEEDLLNEIFTIRGERLMMPKFGTRIPILTFEICDKETVAIIREDLQQVFDNDPRVKTIALDVVPIPDKNALVAVAKIHYIEFNVTKDLRIEINSQ